MNRAERQACASPKDIRPLVFDGAVAGYGGKEVLRGVSFTVRGGEVVVLLGPNGAGKSTVLKAAFGLVPLSSGAVLYGGTPLARLSPRELIARGVGFIPQGHRVFRDLSVSENLIVAGGKAGATHAFAEFPRLHPLAQSLAGTLSGGEKQMLAFASGVLANPRVLLADEPTLGLSPRAAATVLARLRSFAEMGVAVVVVEQRIREALAAADRAVVLKLGTVAWEGPAAELKDPANLRRFYF